jgi:cytosolic 5'-nucleotidase 3
MRSNALDPKALAIGKELFQTYYPIEQSVSLSNAEKLPFLIEWWTKEHDAFVEYKVTKALIRDAVAASDVRFRDGFFEIFEVLAEQDVPTLIFSAGVYDVIHAVLDKEFAANTPRETVPKNVHVVSNMMRFDDDGTVVGFDGKVRECIAHSV